MPALFSIRQESIVRVFLDRLRASVAMIDWIVYNNNPLAKNQAACYNMLRKAVPRNARQCDRYPL